MTQYIKFKIPRLIPLHGKNEVNPKIKQNVISTTTKWVTKEVVDWAHRQNIDDYVLHTLEHAVYLEFKSPAQLTLFMLTWEPHPGVNATSWKRISVANTLENESNS